MSSKFSDFDFGQMKDIIYKYQCELAMHFLKNYTNKKDSLADKIESFKVIEFNKVRELKKILKKTKSAPSPLLAANKKSKV